MTNRGVYQRACLWAAVAAPLIGVAALGCGEAPGAAGEDALQMESALHSGGAPARPIAPLSGSIAGSARPTLRWAGADSAVIELCADRACRHELVTFRASGHTARPPRALPPGVVYWRVSTAGRHHGGGASVVWELFVPDGEADSPNANRGLRYDADADGYADAAVRAQNGDAATAVLHIFSGGRRGLRAGRDTTLPLDTTSFGVGTSAAGDINGDGYGDVAVADGRGVVVYAGSAGGPLPTPLGVITAPPGVNGSSFGFELSGLGDVNGDGYGDLAIADGNRLVWVYMGGPTGPATVAGWVLDRSDVLNRYARLMSAGDCNGDGYGDLLITDYGSDGTPQGFRYFRGGSGGLEPPTGGTLVERPGFPRGVAGDVDGDGVMDLVTVEGTTLVLFRGGPAFPAASPDQVIAVPSPPAIQLGDFDGDGDFDLAAASSVPTSILFFTDDRIDLYAAGPGGLATTPARTILESDVLPDNQLNFGASLGNADFNGDGREDLLVGAPPPYPTPYFDTSASAVFVFRGSGTGLVNPNPAPRLDGTPGFGDFVSAGAPQTGP
jgi:hypothetical protein